MTRKKGFTLIELLVVVAIIALLISILLPSLARAREITKRAVCASNLKGIGQGMKVYANENSDWFPAAPYEPVNNPKNNEMSVDFIGNMAYNIYTTLGNAPYNKVHPSRSLFMLVIEGTCTAKQFICPSAGDNEDDMRNKTSAQETAAQPGTNRFDFKGYPFMSYGYQMPFGPKGMPGEGLDPRMAIGADKGPFFESGTKNETQGTTPDKIATGYTADSEIKLPGNITTPTDLLKADNDKWRNYNSRNHSQEGENVLYVDAHVDFVKKPIVGVNYDNIYTVHNGFGDLSKSLLGKTPQNKRGSYTHTDSIIVP